MQQNIKLSPLVGIIIAFIPFWGIKAQPAGLNKEQLAIFHARNLRQGTLIIRLSAQRGKLEKLQALSEKSGPDQSYWQNQYKNSLEALQKSHAEIADAFSTEYHYSKTCYIFDYQMPELLRGDNVVALVRPDSSATVTISTATDNWYMLTDYLESVEMGHYYIVDKQLKPLESPFPSKWRKNSVWNVFISIFDKKQSPHRDRIRLVKKLNQKLNRLDPRF